MHDYKLTCLTPEVKMKSSDKKVTVRFELQEYKDGQWKARPNVEVSISAKRGTVDPVNPTTNESGVCETQFTPSEDALNSVVTAKFLFGVGSEYYTVSDTARITIEDKMVLDDPKLIKAYNLSDNTILADGETLDVVSKALDLTTSSEYGTFRAYAVKKWSNRKATFWANTQVKDSETDEYKDEYFWLNRYFQFDNAGFKIESIQSIPEERNFGYCAMTDSVKCKHEDKTIQFIYEEICHTYYSFTGEYDTWSTC